MGTKHADKEEVKEIRKMMDEEKLVTGKEKEEKRKERVLHIDWLRKKGILEENTKELFMWDM